MKTPEKGPAKLVPDEEGLLYDPEMRRLLAGWAAPVEVSRVEALAAVRMAAGAMHRRMEKFAERADLTEGRLQLLIVLKQSDGTALTLGEVAQRLHVTPRNVTGLVDQLERSGLVKRSPDPGDRRAILASLTDAGRDLIASAMKPAWREQTAIAKRLTNEQVGLLRHLCFMLLAETEDAEVVSD